MGFDSLATSLVTRLPDSKGPEDVHQHMRDECRRRRLRHLTPCRVYRTQMGACVPSERNMSSPSVPVDAIIERAASSSLRSVKEHFKSHESAVPDGLRGILDKRREWSSPTSESYLKAAVAWQWLRAWFRDGFKRSGVRIGMSRKASQLQHLCS